MTPFQTWMAFYPQLTIGGELLIYGNFILSNLNGFERLATIGGSLTVTENDRLISVRGLSSVRTILGNFTIIFNPMLPMEDVEALCLSIGTQNIAGQIDIRGNPREGDYIGNYTVDNGNDISALAPYSGVSGDLTL